MPFMLNNTVIKTPTQFRIQKYKLSKPGRIANGKMTMDIVAKKRKFLFNYAVLSGTELDTIFDILDGDDAFYTLSYEENGETKTAVIYPGALDQLRFRTDGPWYWKDISFDLIEQ